jgi:type I restriction enzyme, S subunit
MNWPMKPLSELCLLAVDCVNKTAPVVEGPTPFKMIRTTNVKRGFIDTKTVRYVSESTYEQWTRRSRPQFGDVILTREAPVGEVGRCTFDEAEQIFLGQRLFQYRPDPTLLDWNYLAYALQSPQVQNKLQGLSFGATVPHIKVGDAEHLEISCPALETQNAIGTLLAAYDDLIENNQRRIALLEESARLFYREWFVHLRYPGHETRSSGNSLPEGWQSSVAYDYLSVLSGGTPNTKVDRYWGGEIPFFTPKDCTGSIYVLRTEKTLTDDGVDACNSRIFSKETIFITARGTVGKVALAQRPMAMNQSCYALVPKNGLNNLFLFLAIECGVTHLKAMASGGVFDTIVVDTFKYMPFTCPPTALTDSFGDLVRPVFDQIECLQRQNESLASARNDLLPKLMSGELAV